MIRTGFGRPETAILSVFKFIFIFSAFISLLSTSAAVTPAWAAKKWATIAIDARSGKILHAESADALRYPASLTKIMTLYLVFEDLKAGKISLRSRIRFSKYAASRQPSKLGIRPGKSISVEQAIYALVTKSANDAATAVAETLSGTESAFARRMTRTARRLGMTRTTFRNASGLPNSSQKTTARDMATLALRIHRDFPQYYSYFKTRSFRFGKARYRNHNRLLGRVKGVDGIKTGYTRASGFNLTTSTRRGRKRVVAVVLGARSGKSRNAYMTRLINRMFKTRRLTSGSHLALFAGTPPGYKGPVASGPAKVATVPLPRAKPEGHKLPKADSLAKIALQQSVLSVPTPEAGHRQAANPTEKQSLVPVLPDEHSVDGEPLPLTGLTLFAAGALAQENAPVTDQPAAELKGSISAEDEAASGTVFTSVEAPLETQDPVTQKQDPLPSPVTSLTVTAPSVDIAGNQTPSTETSVIETDAGDALPVDEFDRHLQSWNIQIGAFPTKSGALEQLSAVRTKINGTLRGKDGYTMEVQAGAATLHRARFSGFSKVTARKACNLLSRRGVKCFALAPRG